MFAVDGKSSMEGACPDARRQADREELALSRVRACGWLGSPLLPRRGSLSRQERYLHDIIDTVDNLPGVNEP